MKKCPKCQNEFAWGIEACPSCGKKVKNPEVELHLKNAGGQECTVSCKEKIKMSLLEAYIQLRFGIPALDVKPINGKDVAITFVLFALIFLPLALQNGVGVIVCLAMIVVNGIYTKNFYYNAIKKRLADGFTPADDDTATILKNAGLLTATASSSSISTSSTTQPASSSTDVAAELEKLASLVEKGILTKEEFEAKKAKLLGL